MEDGVLWSCEERRNRQYLIEIYKTYEGFKKLDIMQIICKG